MHLVNEVISYENYLLGSQIMKMLDRTTPRSPLEISCCWDEPLEMSHRRRVKQGTVNVAYFLMIPFKK